MVPTRDFGARYNGLATVPRLDLHVPTPDEGKDDVRKILNEVKHLYFDRRYRQCASKCVDLLEKRCRDHHALIRAFLYFYAAMSYDSLARSMHNHSVARIPALQQSQDFYNKALATLPEPLPLQQEEKRPQSPPKLSLSLPAQEEQLKAKPSVPSMWDLNSSFDGLELSSSASRRHSFNSSKHARTDSLVTDVSWTENPDSDPFVDDKQEKPDNTYLSAEHPRVRKPSPLQVRKARSSDSLLSQKSIHSDPPAQTPTRANDGLDGSFQFPPVTPPHNKTPHGFVDLVEGTPIQWTTPSQRRGSGGNSDHHGDDHEPTTPTPAAFTPIQRTHPCPRLLFPRDRSSSSLLPLPLNTRIQHYNADLAAFRSQLVAHLLATQSLKSGPSSQSSSRSVSTTSTTTASSSSSSSQWSEATATNGGGVDQENRRRSAIMFAPETGHSGRSMTEGERAERIRAGRERGWARERFDPRPWQELARVALQECEV
ncbi:hypothetical protein MPH_00297 [Macrophomina phaseolina MS6]|uniref:Uncharacterized protein n=1 Tax=Macrophomina phaseolina (strain MS6) TaxID=1126212 RepID=K2SBQ8_MACPH|nr:hypothetical protein MPH_00297 [Macrophomina phaseolina MS6]